MDCKDSKLGMGPASPDPGEFESVGGSPGLMLTPLVEETDMRLVLVPLGYPVRLLERDLPMWP